MRCVGVLVGENPLARSSFSGGLRITDTVAIARGERRRARASLVTSAAFDLHLSTNFKIGCHGAWSALARLFSLSGSTSHKGRRARSR
eukprot:scaffold57191_cov34-Tisochrysis_lutea.AAC.3